MPKAAGTTASSVPRPRPEALGDNLPPRLRQVSAPAGLVMYDTKSVNLAARRCLQLSPLDTARRDRTVEVLRRLPSDSNNSSNASTVAPLTEGSFAYERQ